MARSTYYSGDLVGLNQAMDSEERNRTLARSANQAFLGQLVGESTKRRGQDTEERMAKGRNETDLGVQQSRAGEQRYATDAIKDKNAFALQESIRNYQLERDKLTQIKSNADSLSALENRKVDALILQNSEEGKRLVEIAKLNLEASKNRYSPAGERALFEANADIDALNEEAKSAADIANLGLDKALEGTIPWYNDKPKGDPAKLARDLQLQLPTTQQGLVQYDKALKRFVARTRPRMPMGAPDGAKPTPTPSPDLVPGGFGPMADGLVPASPDRQVTKLSDIVRGLRTDPTALTPSPSIRTPPIAQQAEPTLAELIAMALPPIQRGEPGKRAVMLSMPDRQQATPPDIMSLQELVAAARQMPSPQGPRRIGQGPVPIGATSDPAFNPDYGYYQNPDGSTFEVPLMKPVSRPSPSPGIGLDDIIRIIAGQRAAQMVGP